MDILTHEMMYRGRKTVEQRSKTAILVCGAGALGSRLLDLLACQGYAPSIVDFDKVERHNLGNQHFSPSDIGKMKATQAANNVFRRLGTKVTAIDKKVTAENVSKIIRGQHLVVDVFDNAESRQLIVDACRESDIAAIHGGMGSSFAEVEWNENYHPHAVPVDANAPCEYPLAVNLVLFTVSILAEVINGYVDRKEKRSIHFTLKDMHIDRVD